MYTKGEWKSSYQYPHGVYATDGKRPPTTTPIAQMTAPDQVEMEANSQLIAKSPRMYEALREIDRWFLEHTAFTDNPELHTIHIHIQNALDRTI